MMVLALAGCTTAPAPVSNFDELKYVNLTPELKAKFAEGVKKGLKDPFSAVVSDTMYAVTDGKMTTACGYVNAKNSFGAYTGDKPWAAMMTSQGIVAPVGVGGTDTETRVVLRFCYRRGLNI
ncbi:MAG: hypothetical protein CMJ42_11205 [Phyllobacteriaceae bacterium]|nr:hypothetical protein [Phyllobacteriaceae bacterium]MBA89268.1 hypothetical protein [Phyllobacteriaceae bacterium]